ncbi:MAG: hypothetical protein Q9170_004179 [Blastenia crenularia]
MAQPGSDFKAIWEEAFALYQQETKRDLKNNPILAHLRSTDDLLTQLESQEEKFKGFRDKKAKLWSVLRGTMHGVELLGKFAMSALTMTPFSYAAPALGAVFFLVTAAQGVSKAYDTILSLLSDLQDFTGRLEEYAKAPMDSKLRRLIVEILTTLMEIFARSERLIRKERFNLYLSVTFLGGEKKIVDAKERLALLVQNETRLVESLTYHTALRTRNAVDRSHAMLQKTDDTTERSEKKLEAIANSMNESRRDGKDKEDQELLAQVFDEKLFANVRQIHEDVSERRLVGTGEWIKSESLYQDWTREKGPLLWILGGPGAGKSFLSSKIISHLQELYPQASHSQSRVTVAYFYIKEDAQQLRSVNAILKAIALQLAFVDSVFRNFAAEVCRLPENLVTAKRTWKNLFMRFFNSSQSRDSAAFLVIDGLDEAPKVEREILLQLLRHLHKLRLNKGVATCRLQFVLVGRLELLDSISSNWGSQITFVEVSALKNSRDITNYILDRINRVKALKIRRIPLEDRTKLRAIIVAKLEERANGMFLWVNLMLDQISNTSRPSDIVIALDAAPRELDRMIRHVFERIASDPGVDKSDLNEILAWVTCARERLTLGEMDTILKLSPPLGEGMPDLEESLRGQFASFFTLSRSDNLTTEKLQSRLRDKKRDSVLHEKNDENSRLDELDAIEEDDEQDHVYDSPSKSTHLEFSHASVRDYLLQEGRLYSRKWPLDLGIGVDVDESQFHITSTLLDVLCDEKHDREFGENTLSSHALNQCLDYLQLIARSSLDMCRKRKIIRPLFNAFNRDSIFEKWFTTASKPFGLWSQDWLAEDKLNGCIKRWYAEEAVSEHGFTPQEVDRMHISSKSTAALFQPMAQWCARKWLGIDAEDDDPELYIWFLHAYLGLVSPFVLPRVYLIPFLLFAIYPCILSCVSKPLTSPRTGQGQSFTNPKCIKDGAEGPQIPDNTVSLGTDGLGDFSLGRLRMLANFGKVEKSSTWHRRFATAVREARYISTALIEYVRSLSLDDTDWATMAGIAICYANRKEYILAIEWEQKALASLPYPSNRERSTRLQHLSSWRLNAGDMEGAIQAIGEAIRLAPIDHSVLFDYIDGLDKASKFKELIDLAKNPQNHLSVQEGEELLSIAVQFPDILDVFGRAARVLGDADVIRQTLERFLTQAEESNQEIKATLQLFSLTYFQFRYMDVGDQASYLWEILLTTILTRKSDGKLELAHMHSLNILTQLYFDEATNAEARGMDFNTPISKLRNLSRSARSTDLMVENARKGCTMLLGLWFRQHKNLEVSKRCFRPRVLEALDILTDEYPENDGYGFSFLARVLYKAGNSEDAQAAMSVAMVSLHKLKGASELKAKRPTEESNHMKIESTFAMSLHGLDNEATAREAIEDLDTLEEDEAKSSDDESPWFCDGQCKRPEEDWTGLYFCGVCPDVFFCDNCVDAVRKAKLGFRICNPDHSFWQVYPFDEKLINVATETVDGRKIPRASWLKRIREEWEE